MRSRLSTTSPSGRMIRLSICSARPLRPSPASAPVELVVAAARCELPEACFDAFDLVDERDARLARDPPGWDFDDGMSYGCFPKGPAERTQPPRRQSLAERSIRLLRRRRAARAAPSGRGADSRP